MSYLPNFYIQICSSIQISNCFLDTWPLSWYPLIHTNHFTVINRCPAATPNHFAAIHLRQNPLVPCGAVFFIFRENLQPDYRPAILHTMHLGTLKTASAVWIWIPRHDLAQNASGAGQRRCNTGAGTQTRCKRRPQARDTSIGTCALPALETEIQFEICIFILDGKSDKQVSTCGHNFKS